MARGSHMTSRYGGLNGSFSLQLDQFKQQTLAAIEQTVQDVIIQIGESLINLSPVDTGRFKGNWVFTVGRPANYSVIRYDKEGTETIAELTAKAKLLEPGQTAFITNSVIYGLALEYGHSKKAPNGFVRITLAQFEAMLAKAAQANK